MGCGAIVVEDLDFADSREHSGNRPSRGQRGKSFRRLVSGLPTAKFRDRLAQMATNQGLAVIAVDAASTSKWGAEHWLVPLQRISTDASGHHAAALVIGRRGLGHRARRRGRCDSTRAEHREERATNSSVSPVAKPLRRPTDREAKGQLLQQQKTQTAKRTTTGDQVIQDRSGPPTWQDAFLFSVEER
jgi:transposase